MNKQEVLYKLLEQKVLRSQGLNGKGEECSTVEYLENRIMDALLGREIRKRSLFAGESRQYPHRNINHYTVIALATMNQWRQQEVQKLINIKKFSATVCYYHIR